MPGCSLQVEARISLLGARDFDGGRSERRLQKQDLVASRDIHIPVAAIQRFCIDERRRIGGTPGKIARTGGNAMDGNAIRQGKRGDGMGKNVGGMGYIPDFDFLREAIVSNNVRVGLVDGGDEDVLAIGRGIE